MKKFEASIVVSTILTIVGLIVFVVILLISTHAYHSYSGSMYELSKHGSTRREYRSETEPVHLYYTDNDSVITKLERKCLEKLSTVYVVHINVK